MAAAQASTDPSWGVASPVSLILAAIAGLGATGIAIAYGIEQGFRPGRLPDLLILINQVSLPVLVAFILSIFYRAHPIRLVVFVVAAAGLAAGSEWAAGWALDFLNEETPLPYDALERLVICLRFALPFFIASYILLAGTGAPALHDYVTMTALAYGVIFVFALSVWPLVREPLDLALRLGPPNLFAALVWAYAHDRMTSR